MAYANFTLSQIAHQFGLTIDTTRDLHASVPEVAIAQTFLARLDDEVALALEVSTEKARSEFIIAPMLAEARRLSGRQIGLLSGVDFPVDESQGLVGICDYIITRSSQQLYVTAPILMLVEAKNEDMKRGYGQCFAEMVAARMFNDREGSSEGPIYGAVTIGERWKFLELDGTIARIDSEDYYIGQVGKIMGILLHLTRPFTPPTPVL